jgi:tetratricopeptide (TPR) repeat protein
MSMATPDQNQDVLKNLKAGRDISMGDVSVEMNTFTGPQEIIVAGVGESPPNFEASWVKREVLQRELCDRLTHNPVTEIVAVGGFGKSWLAAWAYAELGKDFDKRLWVNFRRDLWLDYGFDRFARWVLQEIGFPQKDPTAKEDLLLRELTYRLNDQNRPVKTLVVMDNLESLRQTSDWPWFEQFLQTWVNQGQLSRVLVTARPNSVTATPLEIGGFSVTEGTTFLQQEGLTGDRFADLIHLADGHPLLMNLAATWVRQTSGAAVDDQAIGFFSQLFDQYRGNAGSLAEARVEAIFEEVFETLPEAWKELLLRVSVYRLPFDMEMAQAMVETVTAEDLQTLVDRALLVAEEDQFTLHALIAELVKSRVAEDVKKEAHEQAIGYYKTHTQPWDGTIASRQAELEAFYHAVELRQYERGYTILNRCVNLLDKAGYWRNLLPLYQTLTQHWQPADDEQTQNLGWAWKRLGRLMWLLGEFQLSINAFQQAQLSFQSTNFLKGEAASLDGLGLVHNSLGKRQSAVKIHQKALSIYQKISDRQGEAISLSNLGLVYHSLNKYEQAIELHQQALAIDRDFGDLEGEASSLDNLSISYLKLGKYRQGIKLQKKSLEVREKIGDRRGEANSLCNLSRAYSLLGQHQQAIEFCQRSLAIQQEIGDKEGEANLLPCSGSVLSASWQSETGYTISI